MKLLTYITVLAVMVTLGLGAAAMADDLNPPSWRTDPIGEPPTTMQAWEFSVADNPAYPDVVHNPFGAPAVGGDAVNGPVAMPGSGAMWLAAYGAEDGVWRLGFDGMDIYIPNNPQSDPCSWKDIWLQVTYSAPGAENDVLVFTDQNSYEVTRLDQYHQEMGDSFMYDVFLIQIWPNPYEETITLAPVECSLYVSEVVVDTQCIPEPASMSLVGLGSLLLIRRKRKA